MKRIFFLITMLTLVTIFLLISSSARAQSTAIYVLVKSYIGPGGGGSAGIYDLSNSVGQPGAGEVSAGIYTLGGGFWGGGVIVPAIDTYNVYLPLMQR